MPNRNHPLAIAIDFALGYLSWTQLLPALVLWLFAFAMLAAFTLTDLDARPGAETGALLALQERFPALGASIGPWLEEHVATMEADPEDPEMLTLRLNTEDFVTAATRGWLALSLIGAVVGWVWRAFRGSKPQRELRTKLVYTLIASGCLAMVLSAFVILGHAQFEGPVARWVMIFSGFALIVFLATAWGVAVSHWVARLGDRLFAGNGQPP